MERKSHRPHERRNRETRESTDGCIKQENIFEKDRETERKIERDIHTERQKER